MFADLPGQFFLTSDTWTVQREIAIYQLEPVGSFGTGSCKNCLGLHYSSVSLTAANLRTRMLESFGVTTATPSTSMRHTNVRNPTITHIIHALGSRQQQLLQHHALWQWFWKVPPQLARSYKVCFLVLRVSVFCCQQVCLLVKSCANQSVRQARTLSPATCVAFPSHTAH